MSTHRIRQLAIGVFCWGLLGVVPAGAAPVSPAETNQIAALLAEYAERSDFVALPSLSSDELTAVADGKPVISVLTDQVGGHDDDVVATRLFGWQVVDAPRLLTWLAVLEGPGEGVKGRFARALVARRDNGAYVRYQHIDLPWPFKDRDWVILCEKNVALAEQSAGRIWEHHWSLATHGTDLVESAFEGGGLPGITRQMLDDSIYLPANRGAWIFFELGANRTLVVGYLDVDLGGRFPRALVRRFAEGELRSGFETIKASSSRKYLEYEAKPLVYDGYGRPISVRAALAAGLAWKSRPELMTSTGGR